MSERGVTIVKGVVRFGDYSNGRFCERAGFAISSVEHDAEGVSLILDVPEGDKVFGHHVHLNLSADVLRRLARDHELARSEGDYYPGRQAGSTVVPEETPDERVVRINEALGYAAAAHEYGHDAVETVRLDRAAYNRGRANWLAEHQGIAPVSAPDPTPLQKAWEKVGYTENAYIAARDAAFDAASAARVTAYAIGPYDEVSYSRGQARYLAEHPPKEVRP